VSRPKVLFLPSWYPNEKDPIQGIFIREHAKAASLYADVVVLFPSHISWQAFFAGKRKAFIGLEDNVEGGVRTVRVRFVAVPLVNRIPLIGNTIWLLFYLAAAFYGFLRLKSWFDPDIIHAHVTYPAGFAATLLSRLYNVPLVLSEHVSSFADIMERWDHRCCVKYAMHHAKAVLTVSRSLADEIRTCGIEQRFVIVPNTVNDELFYPSKHDLSDRESDTKRILFVGRLIHGKGINFLLEAIAALRKEGTSTFVLDIVGDGNHRAEYEEQARRLGIQSVVIFHGLLKSKAKVAEFMRGCDFLVLPSLHETFGCVVAEAMMCGKPVLATQCGGPEEVVTPQTGLLVQPGDSEDLYRGLKYMLDHCHEFDASTITQYAMTHYSLEVVGKLLADVYSEVLSL